MKVLTDNDGRACPSYEKPRLPALAQPHEDFGPEELKCKTFNRAFLALNLLKLTTIYKQAAKRKQKSMGRPIEKGVVQHVRPAVMGRTYGRTHFLMVQLKCFVIATHITKITVIIMKGIISCNFQLSIHQNVSL